MISACITDPFAGWLRIKDSCVDAFTVPESGCKRQAAPSLERNYSGRTIPVNSWARVAAATPAVDPKRADGQCLLCDYGVSELAQSAVKAFL